MKEWLCNTKQVLAQLTQSAVTLRLLASATEIADPVIHCLTMTGLLVIFIQHLVVILDLRQELTQVRVVLALVAMLTESVDRLHKAEAAKARNHVCHPSRNVMYDAVVMLLLAHAFDLKELLTRLLTLPTVLEPRGELVVGRRKSLQLLMQFTVMAPLFDAADQILHSSPDSMSDVCHGVLHCCSERHGDTVGCTVTCRD